MRTISALEMSAIDRNSRSLGIEPICLMENAGTQVAQEILKRTDASSALVLCGPGNNGGDGYVAARHLRNAGLRVSIIQAGEPKRGEAKRNSKITREMNIELRSLHDSSLLLRDDFQKWIGGHDVIVDALLGTGAKGSPREPISSLVQIASRTSAFKVAVDLPTGVDSENGIPEGEFFKSSLTITFHRPKHGHGKEPGNIGELVVADIGIPEEAETVVGPGDLFFVQNNRADDSHKGENGTLLVVGGSQYYHGAPAISAISALRAGIDLVYLAVPESIRNIVASYSPSLICRSYPGGNLDMESVDMILDMAARADAVCIGPGLGIDGETAQAARQIVRELGSTPLVIDADGLKAIRNTVEDLRASTIITPHSGEFKTITDDPLPKELKKRKKVVMKWSSRTNCTWVVKGHQDLIARKDLIKINKTGNACMTVGGTGDCLTGVAGALLAKGNSPFRSAAAACFITGKAGELASEEKGCRIIPTDVSEAVPRAFKLYS